ncbi:MAG TPA: FtsX-like permease family protein [Candidatus Binataceae bacterium]|nr:FtsX-like permease family protein [Candidatus Binataceae bacterium]
MIPIRYNVRSLFERSITSLLTVLGVALVAMIFVILFGFIGGLRRTMLNTSGAQDWIVLNRGALDETFSYIAHDKVNIVRVRPEIVTDRTGQRLISPEVFAGVDVSPVKKIKAVVLIRGVAPIAYRVHKGMRLVTGHWPVRGQGQWVVGQKLELRYPNLAPGTEFHFGRRNWKIVGVFTDHDSARESEIWTDIDDLKVDAQNHTADTNSLHVLLKPGSEAIFKQAVEAQLPLDVESEAEYYSRQTSLVSQLRYLGLIIGITLAVGAIFGGMNTMYTAMSRRRMEIGVLRCLGFKRRDVMISFVLESAIIGVAGGALAPVLAMIVAAATGLNSRLMQVGLLFFSYRLSGFAVMAGLIAALIIGICGGLLPAWSAARLEIVDSIREG